MKKTIKIPLFDQRCYIYIGMDELDNYCKVAELKDRSIVEYAQGLTSGNCLWIKNWNDLGTVVHEFYHFINRIKSWIGFDDEETEAYMMTFLYNWYYKNIFRPMAKKLDEDEVITPTGNVIPPMAEEVEETEDEESKNNE